MGITPGARFTEHPSTYLDRFNQKHQLQRQRQGWVASNIVKMCTKIVGKRIQTRSGTWLSVFKLLYVIHNIYLAMACQFFVNLASVEPGTYQTNDVPGCRFQLELAR